MDANKIQVVDDKGNELEFEVLFTFTNDENGKSYVLYFDPEAEEPNVFASIYSEDGELFEIEDPKEWEMIEEVFQSFVAQEDSEEEKEPKDFEFCGDDEGECCGKHEGCNHHN